MRILYKLLLRIGIILLSINLIAFVLSTLVGSNTGGCFPLCKVDPAPSLDGKIVNLFIEIGLVTYFSVAMIAIGYIIRRSYAKKEN